MGELLNTNCYMKIKGVEGTVDRPGFEKNIMINGVYVEIDASRGVEDYYSNGAISQHYRAISFDPVGKTKDGKTDTDAITKFFNNKPQEIDIGDVEVACVYTEGDKIKPRAKIKFGNCRLSKTGGYKLTYESVGIDTWEMYDGKDYFNVIGDINLETRKK